jgi:hypothetical protein
LTYDNVRDPDAAPARAWLHDDRLARAAEAKRRLLLRSYQAFGLSSRSARDVVQNVVVGKEPSDIREEIAEQLELRGLSFTRVPLRIGARADA